MVNEKIRLGVLHGAISNAGDFLIYERGKKLLEFFLNDYFDFIYIERFKPFSGDFDGLIILGGPFLSRRLNWQARIISEYVRNKALPIFCIGLGISGKRSDFDKVRMDHFLDNETILFWKYVYETSELLSVRDRISCDMLKNYGIESELTGCPALFDLENLEGKRTFLENKKEIDKILVSIPDLTVKSLSSVKPFLLTLYFLYTLRRKFHDKEIGIIFQHGYSIPQKVIKKLANIKGIKTYDVSGKSLDSFSKLYEYDVHIGTRLHSHIFFLSLNKPSFLFNVDMRTEAFLKTIETPTDDYTISGIENLVNMLADGITKNNFDKFNNVPIDIENLCGAMKNFLTKMIVFYKNRGAHYE